MREWLENYLEERFKLAERWGSEEWWRAMGWEESAVWEVLGLVGLEGKGYAVVRREEIEVQRAWRRSGDWRAGSTPCCYKRSVDDYDRWCRFGAVGCEREALRALRVGATGEVVDEERDLEDQVEALASSVSSGGNDGEENTVEKLVRAPCWEDVPDMIQKETILQTSEIAPCLKDVSDRIRVPRVLTRVVSIPDYW